MKGETAAGRLPFTLPPPPSRLPPFAPALSSLDSRAAPSLVFRYRAFARPRRTFSVSGFIPVEGILKR